MISGLSCLKVECGNLRLAEAYSHEKIKLFTIYKNLIMVGPTLNLCSPTKIQNKLYGLQLYMLEIKER